MQNKNKIEPKIQGLTTLFRKEIIPPWMKLQKNNICEGKTRETCISCILVEGNEMWQRGRRVTEGGGGIMGEFVE